MGTEFDFGRDAARQRERAAEDIDAWVNARPQDFAKGFVTCWKAWRAAGSS